MSEYSQSTEERLPYTYAPTFTARNSNVLGNNHTLPFFDAVNQFPLDPSLFHTEYEQSPSNYNGQALPPVSDPYYCKPSELAAAHYQNLNQTNTTVLDECRGPAETSLYSPYHQRQRHSNLQLPDVPSFVTMPQFDPGQIVNQSSAPPLSFVPGFPMLDTAPLTHSAASFRGTHRLHPYETQVRKSFQGSIQSGSGGTVCPSERFSKAREQPPPPPAQWIQECVAERDYIREFIDNLDDQNPRFACLHCPPGLYPSVSFSTLEKFKIHCKRKHRIQFGTPTLIAPEAITEPGSQAAPSGIESDVKISEQPLAQLTKPAPQQDVDYTPRFKFEGSTTGYYGCNHCDQRGPNFDFRFLTEHQFIEHCRDVHRLHFNKPDTSKVKDVGGSYVAKPFGKVQYVCPECDNFSSTFDLGKGANRPCQEFPSGVDGWEKMEV